MRQTYQRDNVGGLQIVKGETLGAFYGLCGKLAVSTYAYENMSAIRLSFDPAPSEAAQVPGCIIDSTLKISDGQGGNKRVIEQKLYGEPMVFEVMSLSDINEYNMGNANDLCQDIIERFESLVEAIRRSILEDINKDVRERAAAQLDGGFYGEATRETIMSLFSQLHWELLLDPLQATESFKKAVANIIVNMRPAYYSLSSDGNPRAVDIGNFHDSGSVRQQVQRIRAEIAQKEAAARAAVAAAKANELLDLVCGSGSSVFLKENGYINVESHGFTFKLSPNAGVRAYSPSGGRADMCVHTYRRNCHPIDEIVIAYLHIKNKLASYLSEANIGGDLTFGSDLRQLFSETNAKRTGKGIAGIAHPFKDDE